MTARDALQHYRSTRPRQIESLFLSFRQMPLADQIELLFCVTLSMSGQVAEIMRAHGTFEDDNPPSLN